MNTLRQNQVIKYLNSVPHAKASQIEKAIGMKNGNIYTTLKRLVQNKKVALNKESKRYFIDKRMPFFQERKEEPKFTPNPLINILVKEVEYVQEGIENLETTKIYLERRIDQLKQRDANRARLN